MNNSSDISKAGKMFSFTGGAAGALLSVMGTTVTPGTWLWRWTSSDMLIRPDLKGSRGYLDLIQNVVWNRLVETEQPLMMICQSDNEVLQTANIHLSK